MLTSVFGIVHEGKIELTEDVSLAEGAKVLVTLIDPKDENQFWTEASQLSLAQVWDNPQDDIYGELLEK